MVSFPFCMPQILTEGEYLVYEVLLSLDTREWAFELLSLYPSLAETI